MRERTMTDRKSSPQDQEEQEAVVCRACGKPIEPFSEIYSIGPEHWECHKRGLEEDRKAIQRMDNLMDSLLDASGVRKRQRAYVRVGQGAPTRKLAELVLASAREEFPGAEIANVKIYPVAPYWRRVALDVQRMEGSFEIDGRPHLLSSWHNVTDLLKYRKLTWSFENPGWHIAPDLSSRRTRNSKGNRHD